MDANYLFRQFVLNQDLPPVILCIGSPKISGDSFGPITGKLLTENFSVPAPVYGTCDNPVHALNFSSETEKIGLLHPGRKIIAVDSAICPYGKKGTLSVFRGSIRPGLANGKHLGTVGDWSVIATIGINDKSELVYADKRYVYSLSIKAAKAISAAFSARKTILPSRRIVLL